VDFAKPLAIGSLVFPQLDQTDFTGPFEVLSRIPGATIHVMWKDAVPVRDMNGLILTPEVRLADAPPLDLLHVPGGPGQERLMEDEDVLAFIRQRASTALVFSVCTGALICGAAGLLRGRRATTHWASFDLLPYFGAIPTRARVVEDGNLITTSGVTAGIDGALQLAAMLRGPEVAQQIQLNIEYAPEPPFDSGTPESAPPDVADAVRRGYVELTRTRRTTARRIATRLGIDVPAGASQV
jgi:cyclohexyl-isocyanide hydratase